MKNEREKERILGKDLRVAKNRILIKTDGRCRNSSIIPLSLFH